MNNTDAIPVVDRFPHTADYMPSELRRVLADHSPRLVVHDVTLLRHPDSPTGWLLIVPDPATMMIPE